MRSREEVLREFGHTGWLTPELRDAMADRIRELESPTRPEPVAWALYRDELRRPWDVTVTKSEAVYCAAPDDRIVPLYPHPSAAAGAEGDPLAFAVCEWRDAVFAAHEVAHLTDAVEIIHALRLHYDSPPAVPVVELDEWRVVDNANRTVQTYETETAATGQPTSVFLATLDKRLPDRAPHRVMRVCLRPVDSHQSVPSDYEAPVVPVVTEANENGDVLVSVTVGPVTVDEAVACLRRHGWTIDTAALTAASEVRG